jgi:hypothetical protein
LLRTAIYELALLGAAFTAPATDQVSHQRRQAIVLALQPAVLDRHLLALGVAGFVEAIAERGCKGTRRTAGMTWSNDLNDPNNHSDSQPDKK